MPTLCIWIEMVKTFHDAANGTSAAKIEIPALLDIGFRGHVCLEVLFGRRLVGQTIIFSIPRHSS
jgi:hypothetical protein